MERLVCQTTVGVPGGEADGQEDGVGAAEGLHAEVVQLGRGDGDGDQPDDGDDATCAFLGSVELHGLADGKEALHRDGSQCEHGHRHRDVLKREEKLSERLFEVYDKKHTLQTQVRKRRGEADQGCPCTARQH